jgi:hypothetical protein
MGYAYELSFHCGSLWGLFLDFAQVSADFAGTGVNLHFSAKKVNVLIFCKNHFWIRNTSFLH